MMGESWNLLDSSGNSHTVTFNGDYAHPLLSEGWNNLREFYNYQGHKQISVFRLTMGRTYAGSHEFPSCHSLSTKEPEITLDELDFAEPHQLVLNREFK